jgi:hypothetical protein
MARENQGLQVALIIFVILTIGLSVTTFLFIRQSQEAALAKAKAEEDAKAANTAANTILTDANRLKQIVGFAPTDSVSIIDEAYNADMEKYAGNFDEASRNYRKVLEYLNTVIEQKNVSVATAQEQWQQEKTRAESIDAQKQAQIDQHKAALDKANADLAAERGKFNSQLQAANQQSGGLQAKLDQARKDADAAVASVQGKLEEAGKQIERLSDLLRNRNEQLDGILRPTFEAGDGRVRWVNQRNNTVWINLGQADALRRQMTFSVFPADTNDVNRAGKKAEIEVTDLLGDHLAEARIVTDEISDPILPGDIIYTPVWAPGEKLHFAFTDQIDIDGDGKSDMELVRNLISMNNALIDAELDDAGNLEGDLTTTTRFLVVGTQHD